MERMCGIAIQRLCSPLHSSFVLQVACTFTDNQILKQTRSDHAETLQPCLRASECSSVFGTERCILTIECRMLSTDVYISTSEDMTHILVRVHHLEVEALHSFYVLDSTLQLQHLERARERESSRHLDLLSCSLH